MKKHAMRRFLTNISLAIAAALLTPPQTATAQYYYTYTAPLEYDVVFNQNHDTTLFVIYPPDETSRVYADLCGSHDRRRAHTIDTLFLTEHTIVTAWAEWAPDERSIEYSYEVSPELAKVNIRELVTTGEEAHTYEQVPEATGEYDGYSSLYKRVATGFQEFKSSPFAFHDESASITVPGGQWRIVTDGQDVSVTDTKVAFAGEAYGPADIYATCATDYALVFGQRSRADVPPAYIETTQKQQGPLRISLTLANNSSAGIEERVAVLVSDDGVRWTSIDTHGTDDLKPIHRFSTVFEPQTAVFVRIESATADFAACNTMLFDVWMTGPNISVGLNQPAGNKQVIQRRFFDIYGRPYDFSFLHVGDIVISVEQFNDGTISATKHYLR